MKKEMTILICIGSINLLFTYASVGKWLDWYLFNYTMHSLPLPYWLSTLLIWVLPPLEIMTAILLITEKYRLQGFAASTFLMICFTGYALLAVTGYYTHPICPCGGAIKSLSWSQHLLLNATFLLISLAGLLLTVSQRKQFKSAF